MIKISSISPLVFNVESNEFDLPVEYVQKFARTDLPILIQIVDLPGKTFSMALTDLHNESVYPATPSLYVINDYNTLYEFTIDIQNGTYKAVISDGKGGTAESIPFCIHDEVKETLQIAYTNENNMESFGAVFDVSGSKRTFYTRIEGGFKSDGRQLAVENEQFRTQRQEPINLFSVPYEMRTLSIGDNEGVPFEIARLINNIFCLSSVRLNGVSYTRGESSVPEQQVISEGFPQFNYTMTLECSENISYNGFTEYPDGSGIVGEISIDVKNAADGEVLVFEDGSFRNKHNLESL